MVVGCAALGLLFISSATILLGGQQVLYNEDSVRCENPCAVIQSLSIDAVKMQHTVKHLM